MEEQSEVAWMRLTAPELNARAAAGALVIVPVASLEQHGPHLATGTDIFCATAIAERTARRLVASGRPAVVTPCIWTGLAEHHVPFGGTVTLDFAAFAAVIRGVISSLARAGFRRALLLNGHGGNAEAVAVIAAECERDFSIAVAAVTYWHLAADAFAPLLERQSNVLHACEAETAMVLALHPEAVRIDRLAEAVGPPSTRPEGVPAALIRRRSFRAITPNGVIGDARAAHPAKGEALLDAASRVLADHLTMAALWT